MDVPGREAIQDSSTDKRESSKKELRDEDIPDNVEDFTDLFRTNGESVAGWVRAAKRKKYS